MTNTKFLKFILSSFLGGSAIGIGAFLYLTLGGIVGAIMFSVGLIMVVSMQLALFTGQAQYVWKPNFKNYGLLLLMLNFNIIGCTTIAHFISNDNFIILSENIIRNRFNNGYMACGLLAIPCGYIMTAAVSNAKRNNWLPLLFGIPTFILCGFPHCIADVFYYCNLCDVFANNYRPITIIATYLATVIGNFIGCNLYRFHQDIFPIFKS